MRKMDETDASRQIYKNTAIAALVFLLTLIQIYVSLSARERLWSFLAIGNQTLLEIVKGILDWLVFGVLYTVIFAVIHFFYRAQWIHKNKNIYIRGKWLHIHKKDELRIGVVDFTQDYYTVGASGENVTPNLEGHYIPQKRTKWKYMLGQVRSDNTARDFIACYTATKTDTAVSNDGMHMLTISLDKEGYPVKMDGRFSDTFRVSDTEINPDNHHGQLYMFRMSKEVERYLYNGNGLDYENLENLCNEEKFQKEPFVRELKKLAELHQTQIRPVS